MARAPASNAGKALLVISAVAVIIILFIVWNTEYFMDSITVASVGITQSISTNVNEKRFVFFESDNYIESCFYYDYFLNNYTTENNTFCNATHFDVFFRNDSTFTANQWLKIHIISYEGYGDNRVKCRHGGNSFVVHLENINNNNTIYYVGNEQFNLIDLFNGEYILYIWLGLDSPMAYNLIIKHNFQNFKHIFNCNERKVRHIQLLIVYNQTIFLKADDSIYTSHNIESIENMNINNIGTLYWQNMMDKNSKYFEKYITKYSIPTGRWIRPRTRDESYNDTNIRLLDALFDLKNKNMYFELYGDNTFVFPMEKLHNKWIHFHGKSRMLRLFADFASTVNISYTNENYTRAQWQSVRYQKGAPSGNNLLSVVYFKGFNLLLTFLSHDAIINVNYNWTHLFLLNITNQFTLQKLPNILIMNKGLHVIQRMFEHGVINGFVTYLQSLFESVIEYYNNTIENHTTYIYWLRTAPTHFWTNELHPRWMCRTSHRINCLNIITDHVIYDYYNRLNDKMSQSMVFNVMNEYEICLGRYDCTADNRHYTKSNCKQNVVNILMNHVQKIVSS